MANKNPKTRIVNVPSQFYPLMQREMDEKGIFAYVELMHKILTKHYGEKGWLDEEKKPAQPAAAKEIVRG
ncbi:unnamed protein product [marine sediment metagenome]|uniref:Uncharacterized protein n=1 Tax=marine sediment metagenome TaxID=412755 RepID=X1RL94_9ZZZZ